MDEPERGVLEPQDAHSKESGMNERSILEHVNELVEEERTLRKSSPGAEAGARLAKIEEELDQCWDLLRQRRAKREFGDDPDEAAPRDTNTVEGYTG